MLALSGNVTRSFRPHDIKLSGCNEQVFFLKNLKKNCCRFVLSFSRKTQKMHTLIPKNDVTEPKAKLL